MNKITLKIRSIRKTSMKEQIFFVERLFFLLNSGAPLLESLQIIERQISKSNNKFYKEVIDGVSQGESLSFCCRGFLGDFARNLIYTGEQSGFLSVNLGYLCSKLKKNRDLRKSAQQALVYPAFIAFVAVSMTSFLVFFIFPKIIPVIESLNIDLPLSTRLVVEFSGFFTKFWIILFLLPFVLVFIFIFLIKRYSNFNFFVHKNIFKIPVFKTIYKSLIFSNFCRNLSFLLKGGLTLNQSLEVVENSVRNIFLKQKISEMISAVLRGGELSAYLFEDKMFFPNDFSDMVSIGEKTGNLEKVFEGLGEYYEYQFSEQVKNLSNMIEPILMITVGLVVGFIAISMISPIYSVTDGLQKI